MNSSICPVCSGDTHTWLEDSTVHLVQCTRCKLVFHAMTEQNQGKDFWANTCLKEDEQGLNHHFQGFSSSDAWHEFRHVFEGFFSARLAMIQRHTRITALLDVGCGPGYFLHWAKPRIPTVLGLDLNAENVRYAVGTLGVDARCCDAEHLPAELHGQWDAITCCETLYYMDDPMTFLRQCATLLRKEGVIYIQVPNGIAPHWRCGVDEDFRWATCQWHFCIDSLAAMLNKAGFRILEWETGVNGVIPEYQKGGPGIFRKIQWYLAQKLRRGGRLQVLATPV